MIKIPLSAFFLLPFLLLFLSLQGQDADRSLSLSVGWAQAAAREWAYSPLGYAGGGPSMEWGYGVEKAGGKTDFLRVRAFRGELANSFGASAELQAYGLEHGTLYAWKREAAHPFQWGWIHRNHLQILDFADAANYSPRFSFHSTLGVAGAYCVPLGDSRFQALVRGQIQVLGIVVQSGYVSNAPIGQEADPNAGAAGWLQSIRLFRPGNGWDFSLNPQLSCRLSPLSACSLSYRYDGFLVRGLHASRHSQGQYLLTLTTHL